jgi:hypothetical protein
VALPMFETAHNLGSKFSAGYRKNIADWYNTVKSMVANPDRTPMRTDGRFGAGLNPYLITILL